MIDIAQKVFAFAVTLGVLITFHELGHYVVARLAGVKVLRFSIGFGRVVWSRRIGRDATEWAISAVPLGGYVKMVDEREGDVAPADRSQLSPPGRSPICCSRFCFLRARTWRASRDSAQCSHRPRQDLPRPLPVWLQAMS